MHSSPNPTTSYETDHLHGVRILVVEDDPVNARLVTAILTHCGSEVRVVGSAEEALALGKVFSPRIVITDLLLPGCSGFVLAQQIRMGQAMRDAIVIAMTSSVEPGFDVLARRSGCAALVEKPIEAAGFARTVAALIVGGSLRS